MRPTPAARSSHPPERLELVRWTARVGAVTAGALSDRCEITLASARGRLLGAERLGLLRRARPLCERPSLFVATRAGMRLAGLGGIEPAPVSAAGAAHALACDELAGVLERSFPHHVVSGERELRRDERCCCAPLASARLYEGSRRAQLHRPDLVLWPATPEAGLPLAVEVELSVKAPERLRAICLAWARCTCVAGVLYVATPDVHRALERALAVTDGAGRVALFSLEVLLGRPAGTVYGPESPVAGDA